MNKKVIISLVLVALMGFGTAIGTYAWFTSTAQSTANTFTAGTIDLDVNNSDAAGNYTIAFRKGSVADPLQPGDTLTGTDDNNRIATITIKNDGSLDMFYFENFVLSGENKKLAEAIIIKNWNTILKRADGTTCTNAGFPDPFISDYVCKYGSLIPQIDVDGINDNLPDGKISLAEWVAYGNYQMGMHGGWSYNVLQPGATFVHELELVLPEEVGNDFNGDSLVNDLTLGIDYKVLATQYKTRAIDKLIDDNSAIIPQDTDAAALLSGNASLLKSRYDDQTATH